MESMFFGSIPKRMPEKIPSEIYQNLGKASIRISGKKSMGFLVKFQKESAKELSNESLETFFIETPKKNRIKYIGKKTKSFIAVWLAASIV